MSVRDSETATGVDLKAKPTDPGDADSGPKSHLYPSRATNQGGSTTGSQTQKAAGAPVPPYRKAGSIRRVRVKQSELIFFTVQLAVMLDSGVVLSDALDAIVEQSDPGTFRMVIEDVAEAVKGGQSFSTSLARYPKVFNSMFISMVKASEASGKMVEMLRVLGEYLGFEEDTRRHIKGALTYPIVMTIMALVAMSVMMFFVLPRFTKIYEARGAALPKITQMMLSLSAVITDGQKMMGIVTTLLLASVALHYWFGTVSGRRTIDFVKIRIPILGTIFVDLVVTRSMRIMATMVNAGVNLLEAIEVIQGSCKNYYFQRLWSATDKSIRDGYQLSDSIEIATQRRIARQSEGPDTSGEKEPSHSATTRRSDDVSHTLNVLIVPGIIHMLRAGEKSGQLGQVSDKIAAFYGEKFRASIKSVTALVEPLMIVILGIIIGIVAIAMLLPVFRISSVIIH